MVMFDNDPGLLRRTHGVSSLAISRIVVEIYVTSARATFTLGLKTSPALEPKCR